MADSQHEAGQPIDNSNLKDLSAKLTQIGININLSSQKVDPTKTAFAIYSKLDRDDARQLISEFKTVRSHSDKALASRLQDHQETFIHASQACIELSSSLADLKSLVKRYSTSISSLSSKMHSLATHQAAPLPRSKTEESQVDPQVDELLSLSASLCREGKLTVAAKFLERTEHWLMSQGNIYDSPQLMDFQARQQAVRRELVRTASDSLRFVLGTAPFLLAGAGAAAMCTTPHAVLETSRVFSEGYEETRTREIDVARFDALQMQAKDIVSQMSDKKTTSKRVESNSSVLDRIELLVSLGEPEVALNTLLSCRGELLAQASRRGRVSGSVTAFVETACAVTFGCIAATHHDAEELLRRAASSRLPVEALRLRVPIWVGEQIGRFSAVLRRHVLIRQLTERGTTGVQSALRQICDCARLTEVSARSLHRVGLSVDHLVGQLFRDCLNSALEDREAACKHAITLKCHDELEEDTATSFILVRSNEPDASYAARYSLKLRPMATRDVYAIRYGGRGAVGVGVPLATSSMRGAPPCGQALSASLDSERGGESQESTTVGADVDQPPQLVVVTLCPSARLLWELTVHVLGDLGGGGGPTTDLAEPVALLCQRTTGSYSRLLVALAGQTAKSSHLVSRIASLQSLTTVFLPNLLRAYHELFHRPITDLDGLGQAIAIAFKELSERHASRLSAEMLTSSRWAEQHYAQRPTEWTGSVTPFVCRLITALRESQREQTASLSKRTAGELAARGLQKMLSTLLEEPAFWTRPPSGGKGSFPLPAFTVTGVRQFALDLRMILHCSSPLPAIRELVNKLEVKAAGALSGESGSGAAAAVLQGSEEWTEDIISPLAALLRRQLKCAPDDPLLYLCVE